MKKFLAAMAVVPMILAACSNASVQTTYAENGKSTVTVEASGSVILYSMSEVIEKAFKSADEHCLKTKERQPQDSSDGWGFTPFIAIDLLNDELKKLKDLAETSKGIFDVFPSHTYKVTGSCE